MQTWDGVQNGNIGLMGRDIVQNRKLCKNWVAGFSLTQDAGLEIS